MEIIRSLGRRVIVGLLERDLRMRATDTDRNDHRAPLDLSHEHKAADTPRDSAASLHNAMNHKSGRGGQATSSNQPDIARIAAARLMRGHREVIIQHGSQKYRLRITSNGKLTLTK